MCVCVHFWRLLCYTYAQQPEFKLARSKTPRAKKGSGSSRSYLYNFSVSTERKKVSLRWKLLPYIIHPAGGLTYVHIFINTLTWYVYFQKGKKNLLYYIHSGFSLNFVLPGNGTLNYKKFWGTLLYFFQICAGNPFHLLPKTAQIKHTFCFCQEGAKINCDLEVSQQLIWLSADARLGVEASPDHNIYYNLYLFIDLEIKMKSVWVFETVKFTIGGLRSDS